MLNFFWIASELAKHPQLARAFHHEIAQRTRVSSLGTLGLLSALMTCLNALGLDLSQLIWASSTIMIANVVRWFLSHGEARQAASTRLLWNILLPSSVLASAFGWSALTIQLILTYGAHHSGSQMALLVVAGVSASGMVSLGAAPRLLVTFLSIVLLLPAIALGLTLGGAEGLGHTTILALFFIFLTLQSKIYFENLLEKLVSRARAEHEREVLQTVLDTVPGTIACIDRNRQYVAMNRLLRNRLENGGNTETFEGQMALAPGPEQLTEFLASGERTFNREIELNLNGEPRWHLLIMRQSCDTRWTIQLCFDIHKRKMLELESARQNARIQHSARMSSLGEMASGIAHEINNPLTIIIGQASHLHRRQIKGTLESAALLEGLENIETTAHRITKIIKGLRSVSRQAENDPLENVRIEDLVNDTLEMCRERFRQHSVALRVNLEARDVVLNVRGAQLSQVLLNLLNNAFDAVSECEERWIELDVTSDGTNLHLAVTDAGLGIPAKVAEKIMQPFFTTKEVGKGTGLGLSISKALVESHHGHLELDTTHPHTRFVLTLPLADNSVQAA